MNGLMPQEMEVWYVIPSVRAYLAESLLDLGMKQKEIAKELGLTEAAISQYLGKKRASLIKFDADLKKEIKESSKKIFLKKSTAPKEINKLLAIIKKTKALCKVHEKYGTVEKNCNLCGQ